MSKITFESLFESFKIDNKIYHIYDMVSIIKITNKQIEILFENIDQELKDFFFINLFRYPHNTLDTIIFTIQLGANPRTQDDQALINLCSSTVSLENNFEIMESTISKINFLINEIGANVNTQNSSPLGNSIPNKILINTLFNFGALITDFVIDSLVEVLDNQFLYIRCIETIPIFINHGLDMQYLAQKFIFYDDQIKGIMKFFKKYDVNFDIILNT
ncbi:MAG: hypothetical protein Satyrvirus12_9 [Satyrvirus sp.]|uniref:Uncharacterized protein n=1 Tax=Satyrvirus sp. TaxID=2487771 RepID=A0A3G5ADQ8_9VIRU|nr:MAG: hypothetical protein Satyrvirus12_9 [Satyrvirus sp.]